jgi:hypothetical protein
LNIKVNTILFKIRRLVGPLVLCCLFLLSIAMIAVPQQASAAVSLKFVNANTIHGTDIFNLGVNSDATDFTKQADGSYLGSYISDGAAYSLKLTNLKESGTNYTGTLTITGEGANNTKTIPVTVADPNNVGPTIPAGGEEGGAGEAPETTCEDKGGPLGWILCGFVKILDDGIDWLDAQIIRLMTIDPSQYNNAKVKGASDVFRNIAFSLLIPVMLIMVSGTALGFGAFDAYTVKRALPRMMIAALFIALAYPLTTFLVDLSNIAGSGILGIVTAAFAGGAANAQDITLSSLISGGQGGALTALIIGGGTVAVGVGAITIGIVLSFGFTLFAGLLIGFLLLVLRQVVVIALIIIAPIAILSWIFPGNDKLWKLWRDSLEKALLLFMIFMLAIGTGRGFASLADVANFGPLTPFVAGTAYIIPYLVFRQLISAGGAALSLVGGAVNDKGKGLFDRPRKYRAEVRKETGERAKEGNRFRGKGRLTTSLNRGIEFGTNLKEGGVNPMAFRGRMNEALSKGAYHESKELREKNEDFAALSQDDDLLRIVRTARSRGDAKRMLQAANRDTPEALARVEAVMRSGSAEAVQMAATTQLAATGTGYGDDPAAMFEAIRQTTHGDRDLATRMLGDMRAAASQSGQVLMGGAGFGDTQRELFSYMATPNMASAQTARNNMANYVLQGSAPGQIANARKTHVTALAPVIQANLNKAIASGNQNDIDRELAQVAGLYDTMAQAKPENAIILRNEVLSQQIASPPGGGPAVTVQEMIEKARSSSPVFTQYRREYGSAAQQQAMGGGQQPPPGGGQQPPPGGGPGGAPSDVGLKRNIIPLGKSTNGHALYRFKYLWDDQEYVGVMAQDLISTFPDALSKNEQGYYLVDYAALGIQMYTYEDWLKAQSQ